MLVKEVINIANRMRPGNSFDDDIVERWIDECDAGIQLEITKKNPEEIIRLKPPLWSSDRNYKKGERTAVKLSGEWNIYVALNNVKSDISPQKDPTNWCLAPYETYVGFPHDKLYYLYVIAMMDFANHEYDKYENDMLVYNAAYDEFAKWWQRRYRYNHKEGYDAYKSDNRYTKTV